MNEIKVCDLPERGIYFAMDSESGYPAHRFESLSECCHFCRLNDWYIPVTNDLEIIIDW